MSYKLLKKTCLHSHVTNTSTNCSLAFMLTLVFSFLIAKSLHYYSALTLSLLISPGNNFLFLSMIIKLLVLIIIYFLLMGSSSFLPAALLNLQTPYTMKSTLIISTATVGYCLFKVRFHPLSSSFEEFLPHWYCEVSSVVLISSLPQK